MAPPSRCERLSPGCTPAEKWVSARTTGHAGGCHRDQDDDPRPEAYRYDDLVRDPEGKTCRLHPRQELTPVLRDRAATPSGLDQFDTSPAAANSFQATGKRPNLPSTICGEPACKPASERPRIYWSALALRWPALQADCLWLH